MPLPRTHLIAALGAACVALVACAEPRSRTCDDGLRCPAGTFCVGLDLCAVDGCGDGFLDPDMGEVCDDGNNFSGDGCRADCRSDEVCGNAYIDEAAGELCDDGNTLDGDGCQADCQSIQTCGDGVVDAEVGEVCDDGNNLSGDGCRADCLSDEVCGNGALDTAAGEQCDDGDDDDTDGCRTDCLARRRVAAGSAHTCAIVDDGALRCWGDNSNGQLGLVSEGESIGDDEPAGAVGAVALPSRAIEVAAGDAHTCALLDTGAVHCWGLGSSGQLGYGDTQSVIEPRLDAVALGSPAVQIAAGQQHTCALLDTGAVHCWGLGSNGQLGLGDTTSVGDDEAPTSPVALAGASEPDARALQITAGQQHTCALLDTGTVRCWGRGSQGQLGLGEAFHIGDDELPTEAAPVAVDGRVVQIAAGGQHTCVLFDTGAVRCWGNNGNGQLGYGHRAPVGDDELPAADVALRGLAARVALGEAHTCVVLNNGAVRCWGENGVGQLGLAGTDDLGDDEALTEVDDIDLGGVASQIALGDHHTCALLDTGAVRCWGYNGNGQLGYGRRANVGDDEPPAAIEALSFSSEAGADATGR